MVSKQVVEKKALIHKKLQSLRSISNSNSNSKNSILLDAAKYIQELKQKVEEMNQEIIAVAQNSVPVQLKVEENQGGFQINMFAERSCGGLLVFVLEAFEELGLDVLQARVSCSNNFLLEAVATVNNVNERGEDDQQKDVEVVKEAMLQAIRSWSAEVNPGPIIN